MRTVFAISTAIALFATSAYATNADFNPVNFVAEESVPAAPLSDAFVTFRWKGEEAVAQESFDLMVDTGARIQITDFKNRGDMFEIFDNGKSLGMTTKVDAMKDEQVFAATPEEALKDDRFSKGVFDLAKGAHKITIKAMGPYEAGTAAIRVLDHANVAFHKKGGKDHDDEDDDDEDDKHEKHDDDDDDDEDDDEDDKHEHKKGGHHGGHKDHDDIYPHQNIDLSHTLTFTKTKWVVEKPTHIPHGGHGGHGEHDGPGGHDGHGEHDGPGGHGGHGKHDGPGEHEKGDSEKGDSEKGDSEKGDSGKGDYEKGDSGKGDYKKDDYHGKGDYEKGDYKKGDYHGKGDYEKGDSVKGGKGDW